MKTKIKVIFREIIAEKGKDFPIFTGTPLASSFSPPSYFLRILLFGILELEDYGSQEKSYWHTYFSYEGIVFEIEDTKFGWSIRVDSKDREKAEKVVKNILTKIEKSSKLLDRYISEEIKKNIKNYECSFHNSYHSLFSIYSFYREKIKSTLDEYNEIKNQKVKSPDIKSLIRQTFEREKEISNYSFSLVVSLFSFLDFLMNSFYIFQNSDIDLENFKKFNSFHWEDKFKSVFDISKSEIKSIYDELSGIRKRYRNPLLHGIMGGEKSLRVYMPSIGSIPLSFHHLNDPVFSFFMSIDSESGKEIIDSFDKLVNFIRTIPPYKLINLYLEYGFIIPLDRKEIDDIKKEMNDEDGFKEFLKGLAEEESRIMNRE